MKIIILTFLSIFGFVVSCKSYKTTTENTKTDAKMAQTEIKTIAKGNLYGSGAEGLSEQNLIIENQADWDGLMAQMNSVNTVSNQFSETKIDFSKYTVIAVFAKVKSSGGHSIELEITPTKETTIVNVSHLAPQGMATSVMTQPYAIVKIPKSDLPIVFQ